MATLIGDVFTDSSRFYDMIAGHNAHPHDPHYSRRSISRSRGDATARRPSASPRRQSPSSITSSKYTAQPVQQGARSPPADTDSTSRRYSSQQSPHQLPEQQSSELPPYQKHAASSFTHSGSHFPTPPDSSSPSDSSPTTSSAGARRQHYGNDTAYMASASSQSEPSSQIASSAASTTSSTSTASTVTTVIPATTSTAPAQIPSPESDSGASLSHWQPSAAPTHNGVGASAANNPLQTTIHVRDLAHIQSLARTDMLTLNGPGILNNPPTNATKFEISAMPIGDIIEMVAALLTKITTTNDLQHDALNRNAAHVRQAQAAAAKDSGGGDSNNISPLSSSVLAFHGKNVPAITILSYLSRIHKYCPTTYEVFLSLLVYFDRMTERVNNLVVKSEEARRASQARKGTSTLPKPTEVCEVEMRDGEDSENSDETNSDLADEDEEDEDEDGSAPAAVRPAPPSRIPSAMSTTSVPSPSASAAALAAAAASRATYFVVDSFNIHRLIIAGVTCASKFFSDVFYTNSRYAKVGGLPLAELNHLELQFLLLNDFRLAVPVEDLEAYATMLVEFYAREVVAQRSRPVVGGGSE